MIKFIAKEEQLKEARGEKTQEDMASLLRAVTGKRYQRSFYTQIESMGKKINSDTALAIAKILGVAVDLLFEKVEQ